MKRFGLAVMVLAFCTMAAAPASAQGIRWGVGAGLLMPMGDYGDIDKMGFHGGVGGVYPLQSGLGIRAELTYSQTSHDGVDGKTQNDRWVGFRCVFPQQFGLGAALRVGRPGHVQREHRCRW